MTTEAHRQYTRAEVDELVYNIVSRIQQHLKVNRSPALIALGDELHEIGLLTAADILDDTD